MPSTSKLNRLIVAGVAAAAIAPSAALASPAIDGGVSAPAVQVAQDLRAPDQVDGSTVDRPTTAPVNPRAVPIHYVATTGTPVTHGDGIDGGVVIAIGGGALVLVAGLGLAGRKRVVLVRRRQLA